MKTVGKWIGIVLLNIFSLVVMLMPLGGLLFLLAAITSGGVILFNTPGVGTQRLTGLTFSFLHYGWMVYVGVALFTLFVMTTFAYQQCCVGLNTFRDHICHDGSNHCWNLLAAGLWPYTLFVIDRNLQGWSMSWLDAVLGTFEYWFVTTWKGVKLESYDLREGTGEAVHVSPDTTKNA